MKTEPIQAGNLAFMEPDEITTGGEIIDISPENDIVPLVFDSSAQAKAKLLANIAVLREKYAEVPEDLRVKANYKLVAGAHGVFKKTLSRIEATRKERKASILEQGRFIDSSAKMVKELIEEIKTPFTTAKENFDTKLEVEKREKALAEEKRVDAIVDRIAGIKALVEANISSSSAVIQDIILKLQQEGYTESWAAEFTEKANSAIDEVHIKLGKLFDMKYQQEQAAQLAAEAEDKRIADEEAARVERERLAEEARVKLAEEQAKLAEEREKLAAEQKKLDDERARIAEEQLAEQTRLHNEQKAREEEAERGRLEGLRIQKEKEDREAAERAEAERVQLEKDEETERVAQRLRDEIEALKNPKPVEVEKVIDVESAVERTGPRVMDFPSTDSISPADQRRAAGEAMLDIIGNINFTKDLLAAIIAGTIPFVAFTGNKEVSS